MMSPPLSLQLLLPRGFRARPTVGNSDIYGAAAGINEITIRVDDSFSCSDKFHEFPDINNSLRKILRMLVFIFRKEAPSRDLNYRYLRRFAGLFEFHPCVYFP